MSQQDRWGQGDIRPMGNIPRQVYKLREERLKREWVVKTLEETEEGRCLQTNGLKKVVGDGRLIRQSDR